MLRHRPALLRLAIVAVLSVAQPLAGFAQGRVDPPGTDAAPQPVGIVEARLSDVPQIVTLPGRAVAYEVASVRPRVGGLIEAITYQAGQEIEAGTPMFTLETETLDATLEAAKATEQGAVLARDNAQAVVDRSTALENRGVTRAALEAAQVALSQAEAELVTARAERQAAQLERDRASIPAPITGFPSETTATIGSLVTADQSEALATVTRLDPIYIDVAASSARLLQDRQRVKAGTMTPIDPPRVSLTLDDGTAYDTEGEVASSGSTVSATTGTVALRVKFANPDHLLLPGQFLRVHMTTGSIRAVLVPQRATSRLADGSLVAFVVKDGKAARAILTSAGVANNSWAVIDGIAAGDQVIVDGLDDLEDGDAVAPVTVTLDEKGVVVRPESDGVAWDTGASDTGASDTASAAGRAGSGAAGEAQPGWFGRLRAAVGLGPDEAGPQNPEAAGSTPVAAPAAGSGAAPLVPPAPAAPPASGPAAAPAPAPAPTLGPTGAASTAGAGPSGADTAAAPAVAAQTAAARAATTGTAREAGVGAAMGGPAAALPRQRG